MSKFSSFRSKIQYVSEENASRQTIECLFWRDVLTHIRVHPLLVTCHRTAKSNCSKRSSQSDEKMLLSTFSRLPFILNPDSKPYENVVRFQMANGNQLYVANYYGEDGAEEGYNLSYDTDEGQSVICTSNRFQSLGSVLDLNTIGWNYCFQYPDDDEWDVAGLEVSCGCDTGDGDDATASSAQEQDNSASQYTSSWVTVAGNICILIFVAVESILL